MASTVSTKTTSPQSEIGESREMTPSPTPREILSTAASIIAAQGQSFFRLKEIKYEAIPAHILVELSLRADIQQPTHIYLPDGN